MLYLGIYCGICMIWMFYETCIARRIMFENVAQFKFWRVATAAILISPIIAPYIAIIWWRNRNVGN